MGLAAVSAGFFLVVLDATIVSLALPTLGRDLHAALSGLQWIVSSYTVALAALLLVAGAATDRFGARRLFLIGLVVFALASLGCAVAQDLSQIISSRVAQAIGAAGMLPASLALVGELFPDAAQRGRALGIWGGISGAALGVGPLLGGMFVQTVGWRYVFAINVPVCAVAALVTWWKVPPGKVVFRRLDVPGALATAVFCGALTYAVIDGHRGLTSVPVLTAVLLAVAGLVAVVAVERMAAAPMLTGELLRRPAVTFGSLAGMSYNFGLYGLIFVLSLYLQGTEHLDPIAIGLSLLLLAAAGMAVSLYNGAILRRLGPRLCTTTGMVCAGLGVLCMLAHPGHPGLAWIFLPGLVVGVGGGLFTAPLTSAVLGTAPPGQRGLASALLNASRQFGGALGAAVLGTVLGASPRATDFHHALFVTGGAYFLGALMCVTLPRRQPT
ncbi:MULTISPECIES: MFS transporter [unclassified Streptomyces]|uniref:MFS transporter n=1 Tax=unclassified Streptomyces TaxID=2593676 RepID=UPI00037227E3|nr:MULTISPECIES: MFS transporter [unclassified Streptomyces]MYT33072.1 MFS transporter [Streptomyces sp. SID8354]